MTGGDGIVTGFVIAAALILAYVIGFLAYVIGWAAGNHAPRR